MTPIFALMCSVRSLGMFWWSNRLRLKNLSLLYETMKICKKQGQRQQHLDFTLRQLQVKDETFERWEETRTIWTIHGQHRVGPHMDLNEPGTKQRENRDKNMTRKGQDSKIDRQDRDQKWRIQAHHLDLKRGRKHIYNTIAAHLQYYCSTFTALLQFIYSIITAHFNSSTITTHFSIVTAYSSTFTALLQYIYSIIAAHFNSSSITTHFSTVTAHLQHISAHFSLSHHITLKARTRVWIS